MKDVNVKKAKEAKSKKEKVACTPQSATGVLSAGEKLKVRAADVDGNVIELVAPQGKVLEYTVLVTGRLLDAPKKK